MAGIYLHIPFCRQACHYCDFHFSTSLRSKDPLLEALRAELRLRSHYLEGQTIETIYFGGGTPSLLSADELQRLLEVVFQNYHVAVNPEITLEANPDDLTYLKILELKRTPVNRLSIGIQSFRNEDLKWMNRAHTAAQADFSVKCAQDRGFENITIDLIYSIPGLSLADWQQNIQKAVDLEVQHISAYSLTVEPKTVLGQQHSKGEMQPVADTVSEEHFLTLRHNLLRSGFEQYEVSNFCKPTMHSRHNSAYWNGAHYLGVGPSAHSFNGQSRQWNIANNAQYIRGIQEGTPMFEVEVLHNATRYNEYVMTRLRTKWGIDLDHIQQAFGIDLIGRERNRIDQWQQGELIVCDNHVLQLTEKGLLLADRIASDLFIVET
jgi:oxygen-independent coproporphyrinogen-3 oxidase